MLITDLLTRTLYKYHILQL